MLTASLPPDSCIRSGPFDDRVSAGTRAYPGQGPVGQFPALAAYSEWDLLTRTSWVDAEVAYTQIKKGKATGNVKALRIRSWFQSQLFHLGCSIQRNCGTVLFLGLLLLSLGCVGFKTAAMETNIDKLWVEEGGRLSQELAYTMKILGEGSGTTSELIIQTPENSVNVLTVKSLLTHYQAVRAATRVSVDMYDEKWTLKDLCFAASFPNFDDGAFLDQILEKFAPCIIVTPLDCFWEGSKLLGPDYGIHIPNYMSDVKWTNLNPRELFDRIESISSNIPQIDQIREMMDRAGIDSGYVEKPCLNPYDPDCPATSPNYLSKQAPDVASVLSRGCSGFASKLMKWQDDLIVGGVHRNKSGQMIRAEALQSIVQLMGEKEMYEYHRDTWRTRLDWTPQKAKNILEAWQRQFTLEVEKSVNSSSDKVLPFSSMSFLDILQDFSQFNPIKLVLGFLIMVFYSCLSLVRWSNLVHSHGGIGILGTFLLVLTIASGLGICSVIGIKFNAATTQVIPFLALGLGLSNMFLVADTFAEVSSRKTVPCLEQVGECLKRVGASVLLTSSSNMLAFSVAAIIPIPALRAFCLQSGVLVIFNTASVMLVFPALLSLDLRRYDEGRVDVFCCFTAVNISSPIDASANFQVAPVSSDGESVSINLVSPPCDSFASTNLDGSNLVTVSLVMPPEYDRRIVQNSVCPSTPASSTTSSHQCLTEQRSVVDEPCRDCFLQSCRCWSLTRFAKNVYAPFLGKTSTKIVVVVMFLLMLGAGILGTSQMKNGLEIADILPKGSTEHQFMEARTKFFSYYNFQAVTKNNFNYHLPASQRLLTEYHQAFRRVEKIIRREDGSLPDFWLHSLRSWLLDKQNAFDRDRRYGYFHRDGWNRNVTSDGLLGYKLLIQTGDLNDPIDKHRISSGRLVDRDGTIYPNAFYNYLTAWVSNDAVAYSVLEANLHPVPKQWYHDRNDVELRIPKSLPLVFAQLAFHLHNLGDTDAITTTVQEIRDICDRFSELGLPNYPMGILMTFWEQYLHLRFYLMASIVAMLILVFTMLAIFLFNVWTAAIVVIVLSMMVVELCGIMGFAGVTMNAITAVVMIVAVGIGSMFTVHLSICFLTSIGDKNRRAQMATHFVFAPVLHGAVVTLLGIVMLIGSEFDFVSRYFFIELTLVIILGSMNGLVLLPVLLAIVGPKAEVKPPDGLDYLPPPTPPSSPRLVSKKLKHVAKRRYYPKIPSNISLTTIAEEPSHFSSSDSKISVHVHPEVIVQTTTTCGATTTTNVTHHDSHVTHHDSHPMQSTPFYCSTFGHHVTTVKASTNIKVEVHTVPSDGRKRASRRKKKDAPRLCNSVRSSRSPSGESISARSQRSPSSESISARSQRSPSSESNSARSTRSPSGESNSARSTRSPSGELINARSPRAPSGESNSRTFNDTFT